MATIITYDVPSKHTELKNIMFNKGYSDNFPYLDNGKIIHLPNTTLYHPNKNPEETREELKTVCEQLKIRLERCIAVKMDAWAAIYGDPFK